MNTPLIRNITFAFAVIAVFAAGGFAYQDQTEEPKSTTESKPAVEIDDNAEFAPVDDMHHFMEYISQPSYKALKEGMATAPTNRKEWKPIKIHALILAETSGLVASRTPEDPEQAKQWKQIAKNVHASGSGLYRSASEGKFDEAKTHYDSMIDSCNKCHQVFDKGKHQLEK